MHTIAAKAVCFHEAMQPAFQAYGEQIVANAKAMADQEDQIMSELMADRGNAVDQGGYYHPDAGMTASLMRPSATLNAIIDG